MISKYHQARGNGLFSKTTESSLTHNRCVISSQSIPEKPVHTVHTYDVIVATSNSRIHIRRRMNQSRKGARALITDS